MVRNPRFHRWLFFGNILRLRVAVAPNLIALHSLDRYAAHG
jgi:hypothetical protein